MMSLPVEIERRQRESDCSSEAELSFLALLLRWVRAQAGGEYSEEDESNYYLTARKSYQASGDELRTIHEAGVPVGEIPAVLRLVPQGGIGSEHIAQQRASSGKWANLLSRRRVRAKTFYARLRTGIGKILTKLYRFFPGAITALLSSGAKFLLLNHEGSEKTALFLSEGQSGSHVSGGKNSVKEPMTILYDVKGDSLNLADADWSELLRIANEYGWKPRGTEAPPRPIGVAKPQWDGRYDDPAGQLARFDDARELGEALDAAVLKDTAIVNRLREAALALISWTTRGGFIICREMPDEASPQKTAGQLSSLISKLSSFYADEPSEVHFGVPEAHRS